MRSCGGDIEMPEIEIMDFPKAIDPVEFDLISVSRSIGHRSVLDKTAIDTGFHPFNYYKGVWRIFGATW